MQSKENTATHYKLLEQILLMENSKNHKQPTQKQNDEVKTIKMNERSTRDWFNIMKILKKYLFLYQYSGAVQKEINLQRRAQLLINQLNANPNIKRIIFMDGHGRMLYCMLEQILHHCPNRLNDLKFVVVDVDKATHDWHTLFFPIEHTECIHGNIYDLDETYYSESNLFYFNFCAVGGKKGICNFVAFIKDKKFATQNCFLLSFASGRGFKYQEHFKNVGVYEMFELQDQNLGKLFATFVVTRIQAQVPSVAKKKSGEPAVNMLDSLQLESKLKNMNLTELKAFIDEHKLSVSKGTGGRNKRTLNDICSDIIDAISVGAQWLRS